MLIMRKKDIKSIQLIVVALASALYFGMKALPPQKAVGKAGEYFYVTRVVDGDTLKLSNGKKVRLIGVDTPETYFSEKLVRDSKRSRKDISVIQAMGKKSSAFTKDLCFNKKVRLEYDIEKRDRYGRWLAYVYLEDGTFVNAKILEEGYGQVMTVPPNVRYAKRFLSLERDAREKVRGLWKE